MHREDSLIDWGKIDEQEVPIDNEIMKSTQSILILSENIARLESDTENEHCIPRKDELLKALKMQLDDVYVLLDRQNRVKAIRNLGLKTYHPPVKHPRVRTDQQTFGLSEALQQFLNENGRLK